MPSMNVLLSIWWGAALLLGTSPQLHGSAPDSGSYLGQIAPGTTPVRFAPEIISTHYGVPSMMPDGSELYWTQDIGDPPHAAILMSRLEGGKWTRPEPIDFTSSWDDMCPVVSPDGQTLFFNSRRPIGKEEGTSRERIWRSRRREGRWAEPEPLDGLINDEHLHWQVSVDGLGNLYFGSERSGAMGKDDLFMAVNGPEGFVNPVPLPAPVNSTMHESTPYVAPDGSYIVFSRIAFRESGGRGVAHLMVSEQTRPGIWSDPRPLPDHLRELGDLACPYVSPDGKCLFFLRMGRGVTGVYWVSASVVHEAIGDRPRPN
jgi:hypothetical protein